MDQDNINFHYTSDESDDSGKGTSDKVVKWNSSEYIAHQRGTEWYFLLGFSTVAIGALTYFLTKSYFAPATVVVVGAILGVFASRKPNNIDYEISEEGLKIGQKLYYFNQYKSFSINRSGVLFSITLIPLKKFSPPISAFFEPPKEKAVMDAIGQHLPYEEKKDDPIDRIAHKLKL